MWKTSKWIFIITTVPLLAVGVGMIICGFLASPDALTDDGYPLNTFLYMMGGAFVSFPLMATVGVYSYYKRINDRETNLMENGLQGEAEILSREQTGLYINELPQVKFHLKITSPYGETYEMEYKDVVSMLDMGSINVGAKLPVFIDPNNNKNILLVYS
ncbi:MAG: hypothetical protein HZC47_05460 [Methanobacterium sp.]|uniref:hypothetical protein n=1 Tax=Methanobacterium sp. TaxID=2164 RepID=UPI003D65C2A9|nr:hypothetical protein [Methanobacterium sp.]